MKFTTPPLGELALTKANLYKDYDPDSDEAMILKEWQDECFEKLYPFRLRAILAPMGSGKSPQAQRIAYEDFEKNGQKIVFIVPQTDIGKGFTHCKIKISDKKEIEMRVTERFNLVDKDKDIGSCTNLFDQFLRAKKSKSKPLVLVTTHQTFTRIYKRLKDNDQLDRFKNISIFVDEAHHLADFSNEDVEYSNELTKAINCILDVESNKVTLITATPFRGDGLPLLREEHMSMFMDYVYSWNKYFRDAQYLRGFLYNFVLHKGTDYLPGIREIIKIDRKSEDKFFRRTLVHLAYRNSISAKKCKHQEVEDILNEFKDDDTSLPKNWRKSICFKIQNNGHMIKVVDLVDDTCPKLREKRKDYIKKFSKKEGGPDLIIALNLMKEGSNYKPLERCIIIGERKSLTDNIQTTGRTFRDYPGRNEIDKKIAQVYQLFPNCFGGHKEESFNNYLKAILGGMIFADILIPNIPRSTSEIVYIPNEREPSPYEKCGLTVPEWISLQEDAWNWYFENSNEWDGGNLVRKKFILYFSSRFRDELNLKESKANDLAKYLWNVNGRRNFLFDNVTDLSEIDIDLIDTIKNKFEYIKVGAKAFGFRSFAEVKKAFVSWQIRQAVENSEAICRFYLEHKRPPSSCSGSVREKELGLRLRYIKTALKGAFKNRGLPHPCYREIFRKYNLEFLIDYKTKFENAEYGANCLCDFYDKFKKIPCQRSEDLEEKKAYAAYRTAKKSIKNKSKYHLIYKNILENRNILHIVMKNAKYNNVKRIIRELRQFLIDNRRHPKINEGQHDAESLLYKDISDIKREKEEGVSLYGDNYNSFCDDILEKNGLIGFFDDHFNLEDFLASIDEKNKKNNRDSELPEKGKRFFSIGRKRKKGSPGFTLSTMLERTKNE